MRWRWQRLNSCEKAERRQSFFLQGLSECWVCIGAKMLFASAEEQNKQEENTIIKLEKRRVEEDCEILVSQRV